MKGVLLCLLGLCFIQFSFSATVESVTITGDTSCKDCLLCEVDKKQFAFYIPISTDGLTKDYDFELALASPSGVLASCKIESTKGASATSFINCFISLEKYPYLKAPKLPAEIDDLDDLNFFEWETFLGKAPLTEGCGFEYTFRPTGDMTAGKCDANRNNVFAVTGAFEDNRESSNAVTSYTFPLVIKVNDKDANAACRVDVENASTDLMTCTVGGYGKLTFNNGNGGQVKETGEYLFVDASNYKGSLDVPECPGNSSSFLKLGALLLISLFLL